MNRLSASIKQSRAPPILGTGSVEKPVSKQVPSGPGGGGHSLIWAIRGRAAGQGMVFWPRCPKRDVQFDLPLPYTVSEPVLNRVWYYEPRDFSLECEHGSMVFCLLQVQRRNNWVLDAWSIISLISMAYKTI